MKHTLWWNLARLMVFWRLAHAQSGPDGEITAEEQVQMLLDAKLQCLHTVSTHDLA
ncbi:parathyroid hormone 2 receptor a, partial [Tachysurus ichikawai]